MSLGDLCHDIGKPKRDIVSIVRGVSSVRAGYTFLPCASAALVFFSRFAHQLCDSAGGVTLYSNPVASLATEIGSTLLGFFIAAVGLTVSLSSDALKDRFAPEILCHEEKLGNFYLTYREVLSRLFSYLAYACVVAWMFAKFAAWSIGLVANRIAELSTFDSVFPTAFTWMEVLLDATCSALLVLLIVRIVALTTASLGVFTRLKPDDRKTADETGGD